MVCEVCGTDFERQPSTKGRFCSLACYRVPGAHRQRKAVVRGQRMRVARGHPLAPPSGIVAIARLVLYDKIGLGSHRCHWCGTTVRWIAGGGPATPGTLIVDHVNHDRANDAPDNLVPSCNTCNSHRTERGGRERLTDGEPTVLRGRGRTRAVERDCETCGAAFLTAPAEVRAGKGRFCSRSCARRAPRALAP